MSDRKRDRAPAVLARLPINESGYVDGRSGWDWMRSVAAYLRWRAGDSWRCLELFEDRFHPEREYYLGGLRMLQHAWHNDARTRAWFAPEHGDALAIRQLIESAVSGDSADQGRLHSDAAAPASKAKLQVVRR